MAVHGGPKVSTDGLVFSLDASNRKGISPLGCTGFNGAPQLVKNLVSPSDTITDANGVKLGNLSYYTAFAIDYPESSYGGDAANRQGITPGFNVRSGTKLYDASRALHLWVWNNDTNSWVPSSFFNGSRLSGHCYDSYVGTAEVDIWVNDFNNIKNTFNNITVIAMGSHRDSFHTTAQYDILRDLGAPSNVNSIIGFSSPEWILVGKPGLGAGNAYGWAFQNYTTNPTQVAHLNFGLPIYGTKDNYLEFDGTDDYISTPITGTFPQITFEFYGFFDDPNLNMLLRQESAFGDWTSNRVHFGTRWTGSNAGMHFNVNGVWQTTPPTYLRYGWNHYVLVYDTVNNLKRVYLNGILSSSHGTNGNMVLGDFRIGVATNLNAYYRGNMSKFKIYNRALTPQEIQQNFIATRSRFGI